jgi:adenylate cyclase class 2
MSDREQEIEAKFYLKDSKRMITRLQELEARMIQPRILETNLRFDFPDAGLRSRGQVLRLRHDTKARLTYKGPNQNNGGVLDRTEIEFVVEDHEKARQFIEALGYQKSGYYEKYRTTYELQAVELMLDELPYGNFLEIEGETPEQIQAAASKLNLNWKTAIGISYMALFENVRKELHLSFQDISFENFKGIKVEPRHLQVQAADG